MSYPPIGYEEKLMEINGNEYPAPTPHTPFHFRSSLPDNTFRWPHENLEKGTSEKFPLLHPLPKPDYHYGTTNTRYDVSRLKNDQPHEQQILERNFHQLHDSRLPAHDSRYSNNLPASKKEIIEQGYERTHYIDGYPAHAQPKAPPILPLSSDIRAAARISSAYNVTDGGYPRIPPSLASRPLLPYQGEPTNPQFMNPINPIGLTKEATVKIDTEGSTSSSEEGSNISVVTTIPDNDKSQGGVKKSISDMPVFTPASIAEKKESNENDEKVKEKETLETSSSSKKETTQNNNDLPSYTAMIAQSILKNESNKSTLADIYEYMEKHFPSLERRGTGWRNCVRHTLSLNECFIKLHRPENGRSCNWAIHPSYYETFTRGDYRKRRAFRKRPRSYPWGDPDMMSSYPFHRDHELHSDIAQQQSLYPFHPSHSLWNTPYNTSISPNTPPAHLQHFHQPSNNLSSIYPNGHPNAHPNGHPNSHSNTHSNGHHFHNPQCITPDCFCQYNKNNYRLYPTSM